MRGVTHLLFGLILSWTLLKIYPYDQPLLLIILVLIGSLLPDVDEHTSILGRRVKLLGVLFKHRGIFHGIIFLTAAMIALNLVVEEKYVFSFAAAFVLHLLLDALTPMGVKPFWPSKAKMKGFVRVGGAIEKAIFLVAAIIFVWLLLT